MTDLALTKTERFLLNEVDSCPDKVVRFGTLSACAKTQLTSRGFGRVVQKLMDRNMLAREYDTVALTFAGMRALAA